MSNAHIAIDVYGDGDASGGSRSSLADEQRRSQSHSGSAFDDDTSLMLLREEGTESALSALCTPPLAHMRRSGTLSSRARVAAVLSLTVMLPLQLWMIFIASFNVVIIVLGLFAARCATELRSSFSSIL